jgi:hypothetical protein
VIHTLCAPPQRPLGTLPPYLCACFSIHVGRLQLGVPEQRVHLLVKVLPTTKGGGAKTAPHLEREADRARGPGQIDQGPAVAAMAAGGRRRTGGTRGSRCGDLHVQGQALILEGQGLHLER